MFALLDEVEPDDARTLTAIWNRLAVLLEGHAAAEEKFFYPALLKLGTGAPGSDSGSREETKDAIKDHNDIRDAVTGASKHRVGSDGWWQAVHAARLANSDHMAEEEREDLPDFRRNVDLSIRHEIAKQFLVFESIHASGTSAEDKDPDGYVARNQG